MNVTSQEIAEAVGATRRTAVDGIVPAGYSIDSRTLRVGDCFIALRGPNFDGHQFIPAALQQGAPLVIAAADTQFPVEPGWPVIFVDDTRVALQQLAHHVRQKWGKTVIAVTGSSGKTTTKEILNALLQTRFQVCRSLGNLNNDYGLPLSILRLRETHDLAILEIGMSRAMEIQHLCGVAQPNIGIVTNVRTVHLENFRSLQAIASAKRELIETLPPDGIAVLNNDDAQVRKFGRSFAGKVITFGVEAPATYRVIEIRFQGLDGNEFRLDHRSKGHLLKLPLIGEHNIYNCLPAIAVAHHLGIGFETIDQSLRQLKPVAGRGEVLHFKEGFSVLDDSYNSNPAALEAIIRFARRVSGYRRKILVAGEMLELGASAEQFHRNCGRLAAAARIDWIVGVRGLGALFCQAAREAGRSPADTFFFENSVEAGEWLTQQVAGGDLIVVKGSRGVKTEKVIEALKRNHAVR